MSVLIATRTGTFLTPNLFCEFGYWTHCPNKVISFGHWISSTRKVVPTNYLARIYCVGVVNRCFRIAKGVSALTALSFGGITNANLNLNYITPHPSDLMPARNVQRFLEYPRYFSTGKSISSGAMDTITSSTFNLNQIPDKLIIFCRKKQSNQLNSDSDYALPITGISLNFNNNSGILSSATPETLFRYSCEAGSTQSYDEFSGITLSGTNPQGAASTIGTTSLPTVGSYLMLDFGQHIQLTEDYYSSGSLGNFQLQFQVNVKNTTADTQDVDLVLITVNSGIFVTERGQSSVYTGILTKQDVLDASQMTPLGQSTVRRLIGGKHKFLETHKMKHLNMVHKLPSLHANGGAGGMRHPLSSRLM
jgi:hypothetical protein